MLKEKDLSVEKNVACFVFGVFRNPCQECCCYMSPVSLSSLCYVPKNAAIYSCMLFFGDGTKLRTAQDEQVASAPQHHVLISSFSPPLSLSASFCSRTDLLTSSSTTILFAPPSWTLAAHWLHSCHHWMSNTPPVPQLNRSLLDEGDNYSSVLCTHIYFPSAEFH